jgi:3-ketoacyl-CoA synthase
MGGACVLGFPFLILSTQVLLSNKPKYSITAKYKLNASVRVHFGARDDAYHSIFQREDDEGHIGITLALIDLFLLFL